MKNNFIFIAPYGLEFYFPSGFNIYNYFYKALISGSNN